jgi:hypothetical protein
MEEAGTPETVSWLHIVITKKTTILISTYVNISDLDEAK